MIEPRAHYGVGRVQREFRGGRSGVGLMLTRVDREAGDSLAGAMLPAAAQTAAVSTQHQTADGAFQATAWAAASDVRGSASAISRLQLSPVHFFQRPDDDIAFDSTRRAMSGAAASVSAGKVGGGVARFGTAYRWVSAGFDVNEMGFLTRAGRQSWSADAGIAVNRPGSVLGFPYRRSSASLGYAGDWTTDGQAASRGFTLQGTLQLPNQAQVQVVLGQQLAGAFCTVSCTRGGPALVDAPSSTATLDLTGDPRRVVAPHVNVQWMRDDEGRSHSVGGQADVTWRVRSNLNASLAAYVADGRYESNYFGRFGAATSDTAHYLVARLEQPTRSLTARVDYTLATSLTLQWYAQAYVSRGAYNDVREVADGRATDPARRFRPFPDATVAGAPGGIDYKQLRSNTVLRWEYLPGSTLFVVWSQGRDIDADRAATPGLWPGRDLRDLFSLRPQNTIAVKASYRIAR